MIIQLGPDADSPYANWANYPNVFISKPYAKIVFEDGLGFYILNSPKYNLLPKFYGTFKETYWEFGFRLAGWTFEIMWNKSFKI